MALSDLKKAMLEAADLVKQTTKNIDVDEVIDSAKELIQREVQAVKETAKEIDVEEVKDNVKEMIQKEVQIVKETDYKAIASDISKTVSEKVEQVKSIDISEVKESMAKKHVKQEELVQDDRIALVESLRVIYILTTIDRNIDQREIDTFDQIFNETGLPEQVRDSVKFEGKQMLAKARQNENYFDEINDYVTSLLTTPKAGEHKVSKEWLIWKLLNIAYVDGEYTINERKLIYSVCETLEIDDALLIEMEHTINYKTLNKLRDGMEENIKKWSEG